MQAPAKNAAFHNNLATVKSERKIPNIPTAVNTKSIKLSEIEINGARQPRIGTNKEHIERLQEAYEEKREVFPIDVYSVNGHAPYFLADGFHRIEASRLLTFKEIEAIIHIGSPRDAWLHSLKANISHGLPLTNADKRKKVNDALSDEEMSDWSSPRIAEACGVSAQFVLNIEKERESDKDKTDSGLNGLNLNGNSASKTPKTKIGKDGKRQSATKKKEPKKVADEPIAEIIKDANGEMVPEEIAHEFLRAEALAKESIGFAQQNKNLLDKDDILTIEARSLRETAKDLLAGLKTHLGKHVLCPKCKGKKCAVCSRRGFVSNHFATKGIGKNEK